MALKRLTRTLRRSFITGALVILPLWATILLIHAVINLVRQTFFLLPARLRPQTYIPIFGFEVIVALLLILVVGALASNYLGKKLIASAEAVMARIPVVKTLYQGLKHLTAGIFSEKKIFTRVVLIEFPIAGLKFLGFVSGEEPWLSSAEPGRPVLKVFIPTTPNPTSGFFCYVPADQVVPLDITVDEGFRMVISAGYSDLPVKGGGEAP
jgi:uncharacterized membrane protein